MIDSNGKTDHEVAKLLREILTIRFSAGELRTLAWETTLAYDQISDQNGTQRMAQEIVGYAQRRDKLHTLWDYIAANRHDIGLAMWNGSVPTPQVKPEPQPVDARDALIAELEAQLSAALLTLAKLKAL